MKVAKSLCVLQKVHGNLEKENLVGGQTKGGMDLS